MATITLNNQTHQVPDGLTVMAAARRAGIAIPSLCWREGCTPQTSCMVCVVMDLQSGRLVPSCAAPVTDGAQYDTAGPQVLAARREAVELLLSEHLGDCQAPCQIACPAHMDIPRMIRLIQGERMREAVAVVKRTIALPAVLGRICHAPCQGACRRAQIDGAVQICLLKRYAADVNNADIRPLHPACQSPTDRKIAIVGAGPAGLSAAWYLQQDGHACTLLDADTQQGGGLRRVPAERLAREVVDKEIHAIRKLGAQFRPGVRLGRDVTLDGLCREFDAVLLAIGPVEAGQVESLGLAASPKGIQVDRQTLATAREGVFAAGDCVRGMKKAVWSVADGATAARSIHLYLQQQPVAPRATRYNSRIGRVRAEEHEAMLWQASPRPPAQPAAADGALSEAQALGEAARCLHCDCRKIEGCALRRLADETGATGRRYDHPRRDFQIVLDHPQLVFEPGKCIDCGLCVQVAQRAGERFGPTFLGRGFAVRVGVPMGRGLCDAFTTSAREAADVCPTGALALRAGEDD